MRKLTTILCSMAFMISGIVLANAVSKSDTTNGVTANAATISTMQLPVDLQLNELAQKESKKDTVTLRDTVYVKQPKSIEVNVPCRVKTKTVHVPVLYIATRTDVKEDTVSNTNNALYKVQSIGKCDLKKFNSSIDIN